MKPNGVNFFPATPPAGPLTSRGGVGGSAASLRLVANISPIYRGNIGIPAAPIFDIYCSVDLKPGDCELVVNGGGALQPCRYRLFTRMSCIIPFLHST